MRRQDSSRLLMAFCREANHVQPKSCPTFFAVPNHLVDLTNAKKEVQNHLSELCRQPCLGQNILMGVHIWCTLQFIKASRTKLLISLSNTIMTKGLWSHITPGAFFSNLTGRKLSKSFRVPFASWSAQTCGIWISLTHQSWGKLLKLLKLVLRPFLNRMYLLQFPWQNSLWLYRRYGIIGRVHRGRFLSRLALRKRHWRSLAIQNFLISKSLPLFSWLPLLSRHSLSHYGVTAVNCTRGGWDFSSPTADVWLTLRHFLLWIFVKSCCNDLRHLMPSIYSISILNRPRKKQIQGSGLVFHLRLHLWRPTKEPNWLALMKRKEMLRVKADSPNIDVEANQARPRSGLKTWQGGQEDIHGSECGIVDVILQQMLNAPIFSGNCQKLLQFNGCSVLDLLCQQRKSSGVFMRMMHGLLSLLWVTERAKAVRDGRLFKLHL